MTQRALQRLEREQARAGRADSFKALVKHLLKADRNESYREVGQRLGMSEGAVATTVSRLRQRFRVLLRAEVAERALTSAPSMGSVTVLRP